MPANEDMVMELKGINLEDVKADADRTYLLGFLHPTNFEVQWIEGGFGEEEQKWFVVTKPRGDCATVEDEPYFAFHLPEFITLLEG